MLSFFWYLFHHESVLARSCQVVTRAVTSAAASCCATNSATLLANGRKLIGLKAVSVLVSGTANSLRSMPFWSRTVRFYVNMEMTSHPNITHVVANNS